MTRTMRYLVSFFAFLLIPALATAAPQGSDQSGGHYQGSHQGQGGGKWHQQGQSGQWKHQGQSQGGQWKHQGHQGNWQGHHKGHWKGQNYHDNWQGHGNWNKHHGQWQGKHSGWQHGKHCYRVVEYRWICKKYCHTRNGNYHCHKNCGRQPVYFYRCYWR